MGLARILSKAAVLSSENGDSRKVASYSRQFRATSEKNKVF